MTPQAFLDRPQVGRLAQEGCAVDFAKGGEPLPVMPPEVAVERPVGVQSEKLPDDLDGQDLRVRKLRSGTAPSNTPTLEMIGDEAEDANYEGAKIHERKTPFCSRWIGAPPSVGRVNVSNVVGLVSLLFLGERPS